MVPEIESVYLVVFLLHDNDCDNGSQDDEDKDGDDDGPLHVLPPQRILCLFRAYLELIGTDFNVFHPVHQLIPGRGHASGPTRCFGS